MTSLDDIVSEILDLRRRGEGVDRDAYLQRYPEHARALAEFVNGLDLFDAMLDSPYRSKCIELLGGEPTAPVPLPQLRDKPPAGFEIIRELRRGAEGVVYEAIQRSTRRAVALKMLYRYTSPRLEHEAQLVARLRHPNVVTVYEAGVYRGRPYWAMEMVEGPTMELQLAQLKLDMHSKLRLFVKICAGVAHAHQRRIIHRDLKPANIVVDCDGEPRVLDFGLAKQTESPPQQTGNRTAADTYVGTLAYSAPEQLAGRNEEVDVRSDVYSLGVILFELLTKTLPYSLPNDPDAALAVITRNESPRPSSRHRGLNDDLDCIVLKAIAVDPDSRYQSVDVLADEVERYLDRKPLAQKLDRPMYVAHRMMARHPVAAAALFVAFASVVTLSVVTWSWLYERNATFATMHRQFEQVRQRDIQTLNRYQMDVAFTQRGRQALALPAEQALAILGRYQLRPLQPEGLGAIVQKVPADALASVRADPIASNAARDATLANINDVLDALAVELETQHYQFPLIKGNMIAIGWDHVSLGDALDLCALYVNRAYRRHAEGSAEGAAGDIRAAMLLAHDVGDGVLTGHKAFAYRCHQQNLRFLMFALSDSLRNKRDAAPYLQLAHSYPEPPLAAPGLEPVCLGLHELMDVALVADSEGSNERIDLKRLDAFLNGSLTKLGALTARNADIEISPDDVFALIDRYILCARDWDSWTAFQIQAEVESLTAEVIRERPGNPLLWLISLPGPEFLDRLKVREWRQALRLVAFLEQYRTAHGGWPTALADAVPPGAANEIIDPRTGSAFVYDVHEGMPRLRSLSTLVGKHTSAADGDPDESELEVIFPVNLVHVAPAESAPTNAESTTLQGNW